MLRWVRKPGFGHRRLDERALALNFSFVLHEPSTSPAVRNAVQACFNHSRSIARVGSPPVVATATSDPGSDHVDLWLTSTIGLPHHLPNALGATPDCIVTVDRRSDKFRSVRFFSATAELVLPDEGGRCVGVGGLILRPGGRSSILVTSGPFRWPDEQEAALRGLERLVQAHAGQWMPKRALWPGPAETLLRAEVYEPSSEPRGNDDAPAIS